MREGVNRNISINSWAINTKIFFRKLIHKDGVTPLPVITVVLMYGLMLFNAMAQTAAFSILPKLVKSFGTSELDAGHDVGLIASSIYLPAILMSTVWGYFADTKSSKVAILTCATGLSVTTLVFGFTTTFRWALVSRFMQGSFLGIEAVSKSILADACDDTNFPVAMTFLSSAFNVGLIIGPSIGGFLVFPTEQYRRVFPENGVFGSFPILLPMIVLVAGSAVSIYFTAIYLPMDRKGGSNVHTHLIPHTQHRTSNRCDTDGQTSDIEDDVNTSFQPQSSQSSMLDSQMASKNCSMLQTAALETDSLKKFSILAEFKKSKLLRVLSTKTCFVFCFVYGLIAIVGNGNNESFCLLAATKKEYHGMGFTTSQIGTVLLIASACAVPFHLTIMPKAINYLGSKKSLIGSALGFIFLVPMMPAVIAVKNRILFWFLVSFIVMTRQILITSLVAACNVLVTNSVPLDIRGSANGVATTMASAGRLIAPVSVGSIYSWSLHNIQGSNGSVSPLGFPFNQFFVFYIQSIVCIIIAVLASTTPDSIDSKKARKGSSRFSEDNRRTSSSVEPDVRWIPRYPWILPKYLKKVQSSLRRGVHGLYRHTLQKYNVP